MKKCLCTLTSLFLTTDSYEQMYFRPRCFATGNPGQSRIVDSFSLFTQNKENYLCAQREARTHDSEIKGAMSRYS